MKKVPLFVLATTVALALAPSPAIAYIDPGSGSAIMSAIIGLLVVVGLFFKSIWYKITSIFMRKSDRKKKTPEGQG
jgi:hypothetical protein